MNDALVSIIVPCYNQAHYLAKTLDSVLTQSYVNWECLIVNDGSTDNTEIVVQEFIKRDFRFKLISIPNSGVCVARNTAIRQSKGKYIFPLDSDNYLHSQCIEKFVSILINNTNIKLVYSETQLFGDRSGLMNLPAYSYKQMLICSVIDNSAMFLREDFDRVGGYRLNMKQGLEDWDLWISILAEYNDDQVVKIDEALYFYRINSKSRSESIYRNGIFAQLKDLLVYNNYVQYQKYYPDIFFRIQKHDYYLLMMNKPLIKLLVGLYNKLSRIKAEMKLK